LTPRCCRSSRRLRTPRRAGSARRARRRDEQDDGNECDACASSAGITQIRFTGRRRCHAAAVLSARYLPSSPVSVVLSDPIAGPPVLLRGGNPHQSEVVDADVGLLERDLDGLDRFGLAIPLVGDGLQLRGELLLELLEAGLAALESVASGSEPLLRGFGHA